MKKYFFALLLSTIVCQNVWANLKLDIALINKKGIDKGLVLVNELHSSEEVVGLRPAVLTMKDNLRLEIFAILVPDYGTFGPSSLVKVYGKIYGPAGTLLKDYTHSPLVTRFGKSCSFSFEREDVGQSIEVSIIPTFIY